jgi:hypothetical protein
MAHTISLEAEELDLLLAALHACTPSGGGSKAMRLGLKIKGQTGVRCESGSLQHLRAMKTATQEFLGEDLFMELEEAGKLPA